MFGLSFTNFSKYMKTVYLDFGLKDSLMTADKVLRRITTMQSLPNLGGNEMYVPIRAGMTPAQSKKFGIASSIGRKSTGARVAFNVPYDKDFGVSVIENKVIYASMTSLHAFVGAFADETDNAILALRNKRCSALLNDSGQPNAIGRIKAGGIASGRRTITLNNPVMANFEVNMELEFSTSNAAASRAGGPYTIESVDRKGGKITLTAALHASIVVNDYVFRNGDRGETALTSFFDYLPGGSTPGSLHGLNRNIDPLRLAGQKVTKAIGTNFAKTVREVAASIDNLSGRGPNAVYVSPLVENKIAAEQEQNINFVTDGGKRMAEITYIGQGRLGFQTSNGVIELVSSPFMPPNKMLLLTEEAFHIGHLKSDFVSFVQDAAGGIYKQAHDSPGREVRLESYGNLCCQAPGLSAQIELTGADIPTFA